MLIKIYNNYHVVKKSNLNKNSNNKNHKQMKKLIMICCLFATLIATAQGPLNITVTDIATYHNGYLTFCDFDSINQVIVQKNPNYGGTPFWIDENDNVTHANFVVITNTNDGHLVYIEKDNELLIGVNIRLLANEMPEPSLDTVWLHEDMQYNVEPIVLRPTEEDPDYIYIWESDNWPQDSLYQGFELEISNAGFYRCNMWDQCLHYSKAEFFVEKAPVIGYVSTNLNLNLNELHWTPKGSTYDTIAIFRNGYIAAIKDKHAGVWVDPVFNNEGGTPWYVMYAIQNGRIIEESASRWKTGISLELQNVTTESIDLGFYGPDNEIGYPLDGYVQYHQLYSVETTGFGLVQSMIPVGTTELLDIANNYDVLVVAAVLWNGTEVYSNMVFPNGGTTSCGEKEVDKIQVYPNPAKDELFVPVEDAKYRIFNIQGQTVQNGKCKSRINISNLNSGVYLLEIQEKDSTTTIKFVVE